MNTLQRESVILVLPGVEEVVWRLYCHCWLVINKIVFVDVSCKSKIVVLMCYNCNLLDAFINVSPSNSKLLAVNWFAHRDVGSHLKLLLVADV